MSKIPFRDFRWIGPYLVDYYTKIILSENSIKIQPKSSTESASENTTPRNLLKKTIRKLNGRLTIMSLSQKMIYKQLHGKRILVDTYLTFLSYILILTQLISMKVTHRDQILLLFHFPIFLIQAMVKTGKLAPLLTQLYYIPQILNRMVKIRTLTPRQS